MPVYLIPRSDMCMSDPMPFSQHWEARIPFPIEQIDDMGLAFQSAYSSLKAGDLVNVCAYADKNFLRLTEAASFRVVSCVDRKIEASLVSEIFRVAASTSASSELTQHDRLEIVKAGSAFEVRDEAGNPIEVFVDLAQAESFVKRSTAPKVKTSKGDDRSGLKIVKGIAGRWLVKDASGATVKEFRSRDEAESFLGEKKAA